MRAISRSIRLIEVALLVSLVVIPAEVQGIKYVFSFGDSYSDVGFKVADEAHPNPANFEGNPVPPGTSAAYANNFLQDLCSVFNTTLTYLYDFAYSGAIVDANYVSPFSSVNNTFKAQVDYQFLPYLAPKPSYAPWTSESSLFTIFFGINDIERPLGIVSTFDPFWDSKVPAIMGTYWNLTEKLYNAGARNFVFINVPTIWTSPDVTYQKNTTLTEIAYSRTILWNTNVLSGFNQFKTTHPDANSSFVDSQELWQDMTANPSNYGLQNVTDYCSAYKKGTGTNLTAYSTSCSAPVNQYLWLNALHPTWVVHRYLARKIINVVSS